jgi:small subunit ribosomal protein S9
VTESPEDRERDAAQEEATEQVAANEEPGERDTPTEEVAGQAQVPEPLATAPANADDTDDETDDTPAPRERPLIPGADLEVDIVGEGDDPLALARADAEGHAEELSDAADEQLAAADDQIDEPIAVTATIDLATGARYRATGKRKTAIARVILRPGTGAYTINGKPLDTYFPRPTLQREIRQPLEAVGYEEQMDVVARMHGGGVSAQAGALRHGISRALLVADPNLRGELKKRGYLTRDARAKERKKAGLKKARKRPQFSKR